MRTQSTAIAAATAIVLLAAGSASAQVGKETDFWNWTVTANHHKSIVKIDVGRASATGVIIHVNKDKPVGAGYEGYCLTAWHVVEPDGGKRNIDVTFWNGRVAEDCLTLEHDKERDVAIIWVWIPDDVTPAKVATRDVKPGDELELAGLGGGSRLKKTLRHFACKASFPTSKEKIFADVPLLPGDSGGPVFNADQEIVGVISGGWFWWDGGVKTASGSPINVTWPARACNVAIVQDLLTRTPDFQMPQMTQAVESGDGTGIRHAALLEKEHKD